MSAYEDDTSILFKNISLAETSSIFKKALFSPLFSAISSPLKKFIMQKLPDCEIFRWVFSPRDISEKEEKKGQHRPNSLSLSLLILSLSPFGICLGLEFKSASSSPPLELVLGWVRSQMRVYPSLSAISKTLNPFLPHARTHSQALFYMNEPGKRERKKERSKNLGAARLAN